MTYRVSQAIYQAWCLRQLTDGRDAARVVEIGPGLGRTAFYAHHLGLTDYTLVDIPISSLAQGYFLGRVLGETAIALDGEDACADQIKIISPERFLAGEDRYDIVLNADSLTEIGYEGAHRYYQAIRRRASVLLSINHERNDTTMADLMAEEPYLRIAAAIPTGSDAVTWRQLPDSGREHRRPGDLITLATASAHARSGVGAFTDLGTNGMAA